MTKDNLTERREPAIELQSRLEEIGGCTDGNCEVIARKGMRTNGGCRCFRNDSHKASRVVSVYKVCVKKQHTIHAQQQALLAECAVLAEEALDACRKGEWALIDGRLQRLISRLGGHHG